MGGDGPGEDVAMQTRCPHCLGEQWALTVLPFSYGETGCTVCGQKTEPMTDRQWREALRGRRDGGPGFGWRQ